MSLQLVYTGDPLPYELTPEDTDPVFWRDRFSDPNLYWEQIWWVTGVFVRPDPSVHQGKFLSVFVVVRKGNRAGAAFKRYDYDYVSGEVLQTQDYTQNFSLLLGVKTLSLAWDGSLWSLDNNLDIIKRDFDTMESLGTVYASSHFNDGENVNIRGFAIDEPNNRAILGLWNQPNDLITIHALDNGAIVGSVRVAGIIEEIFPAEAGKIYVLTQSGLLTLVDYQTGEALTVLRVQLDPPVSGVNQFKACWDRFLHRVFIFSHTEENADGSATARLKGYFPRPLPVGVTDPLPLVMPVKDRRVPIVGHVYGDAGEPISGKAVTAAFTGPLTPSATVQGTDGRGDVWFDTTAETAGAQTIEFTVEV